MQLIYYLEYQIILSYRMKVSCGGLLYAFDSDGDLGLILGYERCGYFPLKGRKEQGETIEQAAIREIYEESCGIVDIMDINLDCKIDSAKKRYYLGLVPVKYDIIQEFADRRKHETRSAFIEIEELKFYKLSELLTMRLPLITYKAISFYKDILIKIANNAYITDDNAITEYEMYVNPIKYQAKLRVHSILKYIICAIKHNSSIHHNSSLRMSYTGTNLSASVL
jgi:hypothetical protein